MGQEIYVISQVSMPVDGKKNDSHLKDPGKQ